MVARQYLALSTAYIRVLNFTFVLKTAAKYLKTVTVLVYRFQIYKSEYINPNNKKSGKTCQSHLLQVQVQATIDNRKVVDVVLRNAL